jgi:3-phenylpropionate/cinnamic acid dioxygenase small subunit
MDSNDLERERGITILAKATSVVHNDIRINANLVVYRSDEEGVSSLYMVARYEAEVAEAAGRFLIRRMAVVVDSFGIDTMLAVPL